MGIPEVLAPAGDRERLEAAVLYGADAVYLAGTQFGMRASAATFTPEDLKSAVDYCHQRDVCVYLTCNVLPKNSEIADLKRQLPIWQSIGIDALIVSDIGVLQLAKRTVPGLELHVSTQAGITNYLTATELYHLGAHRVVLARELSLDDIREIRRNTPPELMLEAFVHGAMCVSFSGRCLISQYMTGRDANHGECAQSCRWNYHLVEEKRPGEYYPVVEEDGGTYFFNAKDLCMLPYLDQLYEAGIDSFKIEGRAKSVSYAAATTNMYRVAVDILKENNHTYQLPDWLLQEPYKISHRAYSTGFFFPDQQAPGQVYENAGYLREWEVSAVVEGWQGGYLLCTQRNKFSCGEQLELLEPGREPVVMTVTSILNEEQEQMATAPHPMQLLKLPYPVPVAKGAMLRRQVAETTTLENKKAGPSI